MFKNPIKKYQSGGPVTQEQAEDQIVSVIALQLSGGDQQKAKSLLGPVKQRLQEIKSNEQESQILKAGLQKLQNNDESGMQDILSLFANAPQKAKLGAKLQAFICKHANGKKIPDCGCNEDGGKVEKNQSGKRINLKNRTIAEVNDGLSEWEAEELGIDPNTLANTGVTITAYPNKKPYVVDGMLPFFNRNGLAFQSGGVEASSVEDGSRLGSPAIPGRKYKVSTIGGQDYYANPDAMRYPVIVRYASPVDTVYNLGFQTYGSDSPAYSGIRAMYNSAIQHPNTFAWDKDSYTELQRQKNEKKEDGGKVEKNQQKNGGRGKVAYPRQTSAGKENGYSIANRTWENNIDGSTSSVEIAVGPDGKAVLQRITDRSNMPDRGMLAVRDTVNHIGIVNPLTGIFEEDYDNPGFSTGAHPYFQEIPWNQVKYWSPDYKNGGKTPNWINKKKNK